MFDRHAAFGASPDHTAQDAASAVGATPPMPQERATGARCARVGFRVRDRKLLLSRAELDAACRNAAALGDAQSAGVLRALLDDAGTGDDVAVPAAVIEVLYRWPYGADHVAAVFGYPSRYWGARVLRTYGIELRAARDRVASVQLRRAAACDALRAAADGRPLSPSGYQRWRAEHPARGRVERGVSVAPTYHTLLALFGSFRAACAAAGVAYGADVRRARRFSDGELKAALRRCAAASGGPLTAEDFDRFTGAAGPSSCTVAARFGSWYAALEAAGLEVPAATVERCRAALDRYLAVCAAAGRTATRSGYDRWRAAEPDAASLPSAWRVVGRLGPWPSLVAGSVGRVPMRERRWSGGELTEAARSLAGRGYRAAADALEGVAASAGDGVVFAPEAVQRLLDLSSLRALADAFGVSTHSVLRMAGRLPR